VSKFFIMTSLVSTIFSSIPVKCSFSWLSIMEYTSRTWDGPSPKFVNSMIAERSVGL